MSFLRTVPPYSHQADVWVELLSYFKYKKIIFIHSSNSDGRAILGRFQTNSKSLEEDADVKVKVEFVVEFETSQESYKNELFELKDAQSRVFLLYAE